jgi:hypothetical protein
MNTINIFRIFCGIILLMALSFAVLTVPAKAQSALTKAEFIVIERDSEVELSVRADDMFQGDKDIYNARAWVRITFKNEKGRTYYARENINCVAQTSIREFLIVVEPNGKRDTFTSSEVEPIIPDSNLYAIAYYVCVTAELYLEQQKKTSAETKPRWEA